MYRVGGGKGSAWFAMVASGPMSRSRLKELHEPGWVNSAQKPAYEPLSKLLVSPLRTPIVVPYIIPYITPFKEFRQQYIW